MIAARALARNVAATEQDWNASINSRPGTEYMCVNPVRHNEPHISVSSGDHHLHKVKCYRFSDPMEEEVVNKVVYKTPAVVPVIPVACAAPKPPKSSTEKSTRNPKDGK